MLRQELNVKNRFTFSKGEVVINVGAYIDAYTLRAGKKGCKVMLSSKPLLFSDLSLNVKDNGFNNVELFNMAVRDYEGEVFINLET